MLLSPFLSKPALFGARKRAVKFFVLCTPVVCTGGPPIFANPPSKSVKPPKADRLVSAFKAPGFVNSCANGIADAKELFEVVVLDDDDDDEDAVRAV